MYLEASDHACPHIREQRLSEAQPRAAVHAPQASCPFGTVRAPAEPHRAVTLNTGTGGWWAFKSQAMTGATA